MENDQYLTEIKEALRTDTTRLGDVWRLTQESKSAGEIAEELGAATPGFVYNYRYFIAVMTDGATSNSPTRAIQTARALRSFLNRFRRVLSDQTIQRLDKIVERCDSLANDLQGAEKENLEAEKQTTEAFKNLPPGIYVYTYLHYYRHPVIRSKDDLDPRTYLKIGRSGVDAYKRVMQQRTGMPEPPVILQFWVAKDDCELGNIETRIHRYLREIGHGIPNKRHREWFLTNNEFIAATLKLVGLKCYAEYDFEKSKLEVIVGDGE